MSNFNVGVLEPSVLSYKWEVDHFSNAARSADVECRLYSPVFSIRYAGNAVEWRLCLYVKGYTGPAGKNKENKDYLSICAELIGENSIYTAVVAFSILNIENKTIVKRVMKEKLFTTKRKTWGFFKFAKRDFIVDEHNHVLNNDTLTILCEIDLNSKPILVEPFKIIDENNVKEEDEETNYRLKEFDDFEKLVESETFSDMTFVIEEKKIHVHKAILVSRSPVFKVMLQCYPKEKQQNSLEITGIEYDVMRELLRFMYVGKVNDIDLQATDLLIAADKYCITGLKTLCEAALYKNLSINNALEYLNLAAICDTAKLKSQVIEFIAINLNDVVEKPEFELFGDLNSQIICEVVRAIAKIHLKH